MIIHREDISPRNISPRYISPHVHFTSPTFHPTYVSPQARFTSRTFHPMDIIPRKFHPTDMSLQIICLVWLKNILHKSMAVIIILMTID